ncbi:MAG: carboxypeptidase regulatory-like domain-containing protein [Terriglobia bacterium]
MNTDALNFLRKLRQWGCNYKSWIGVSAALLFLISGTPQKSAAQVLYGSLTGRVTDPSGAPVPQAKVDALNTGTGIAQQATTDSNGMYLFTHLQSGTYRLTISAPSFGILTEHSIHITTNTEERVDAQLQVAKVRQSVTVGAPLVTLQTQRADVESLMTSSQVSALPLTPDNNFQTLYMLVPGLTPPRMEHSDASNPTGGLMVDANGQGQNSNAPMIDGTPNPNYWEENMIAYVPPHDAIQSVNIVTSNYDAEQGNASGAVTNVVIKSGTNQFHGAAWEYNTTSSLQARNFFFYGGSTPKNILNQFGLNLGGPIVKNKLFFFADWERYRQSTDENSILSLPPVAIRNGDFSGTGTTIYNPYTGSPNGTARAPFTGDQIPASLMSSAAQKMTALIPAPNYGTPGSIANNYFTSGDLLWHRDSVDLKMNYNPSGKVTMFGRYSAEPTFINDPQMLGAAGGDAYGETGQPGQAHGLTQSATLAGTYTFTPNLLFDANIGVTRQALNVAPTLDAGTDFGSQVLGIPGTNGPSMLQKGQPGFTISGLADLGNTTVYNPFFFWDNEFLYAANLSWVKGSHSLRFGFSFTRAQLNHIQTNVAYAPRGGFNFDGGVTALNGGVAPNAYNSWGQFLLGLPSSFGKDNDYLIPIALRASAYAFYARDIWQATPKLSVDYGLRYEYYPYATHAHFGGSTYDPTNNLMYLGGFGGVPSNAFVNVGSGQVVPRLGIAYRVSARTAVRAGFGMFTDPERYESQMNFYPADISQQFTGVNSLAYVGSLATGIPSFTGPNLSLGKLPLPTYVGTDAYALNIHRGYVEAYNFTVQRNMGAGFNAQLAYVGNNSVRLFAVQNINAAGPGQGVAGGLMDRLWGNPNSIGLEAPFAGGNYNSLQAQLTRRVHGTQMGFSYTYSKAMDYVDAGTSGLMWNWVPILGRNRALAGFDQTNNFEYWAIYDSPFGHGHRWVNHGVGAVILGGWTLSPIVGKQSGVPFSITSSGASLNAPGNSQTADQVVSNVAILGGHGPNQPYFAPSAFAPVTAVRFGTTGRDILRGPGAFELNASLARTFSIHERFQLQFRVDTFSLTNTPNFGNPGANVSNAKFVNGILQSFNGYDNITSTDANALLSGQRQIRFALKFSF